MSRGSQSRGILPEDTRLRSASATGANPGYGIENVARDPHGGSSEGIQGSIDSPSDGNPAAIGDQRDLFVLIGSSVPARSRMDEPAIKFASKPCESWATTLEVSNPFRSIGAGVVVLVGVAHLSISRALSSPSVISSKFFKVGPFAVSGPRFEASPFHG